MLEIAPQKLPESFKAGTKLEGLDRLRSYINPLSHVFRIEEHLDGLQLSFEVARCLLHIDFSRSW